jgi:redox-sensing transcriptional repressor
MSSSEPRMSRASVARFSLYLRSLEEFSRQGLEKISSGRLGASLAIRDAQVRKDLAYLGSLGHPGVGYPVAELIAAIRHVLGIDRPWRIALAGVGNLARALLRYRGFREQGFRVVALFDADATKIGQVVEGLEVFSPDRMPAIIAETRAELGALAVPSEAAQRVADQLAAAGVRGILNFAPVVLRLPPHVCLVSVDLTVQFEQLAFLVQMGKGD